MPTVKRQFDHLDITLSTEKDSTVVSRFVEEPRCDADPVAACNPVFLVLILARVEKSPLKRREVPFCCAVVTQSSGIATGCIALVARLIS